MPAPRVRPVRPHVATCFLGPVDAGRRMVQLGQAVAFRRYGLSTWATRARRVPGGSGSGEASPRCRRSGAGVGPQVSSACHCPSRPDQSHTGPSRRCFPRAGTRQLATPSAFEPASSTGPRTGLNERVRARSMPP